MFYVTQEFYKDIKEDSYTKVVVFAYRNTLIVTELKCNKYLNVCNVCGGANITLKRNYILDIKVDHCDKCEPKDVIKYASELNNQIYE